MLILVDYDNLSPNEKSKGLDYLVSRILTHISPIESDGSIHLKIRLYGGWYNSSNITLRAQNLSSDIFGNFPDVYNLSDNRTRVIVNCELAYSLLADPTNHLLHTYRPRGIPSNLRAKAPASCGCTLGNCPIKNVFDFVSKNICSTCLNIKPEHILYRGEQKLVDTMLTADLIFSSTINQPLCIVSSDDDFWPGIMTVLSSGKGVIHIQTRNRRTPNFYTINAGNKYIQKIL